MQPRVEFVVTARPSWARIKSLVQATVQKLGPEEIVLTTLGPVNSRFFGGFHEEVPEGLIHRSHHTLLDNDSLTTVGLSAIEGSRSLLQQWESDRPRCVVVVADRTETLGVTVAASLAQIPVVHVQGGEVSGSIDDRVRDANSKLADLHLTTNEQSKANLLKIGEDENRIHIIGCPSIDLVRSILLNNSPASTKSVFKSLNSTGVGVTISSESEFGIVMFHPDTLHFESTVEWTEQLIRVVEASPRQWIWFWPNSDFGNSLISSLLRKAREQGRLQNCRFVINLPPETFIQLAVLSSVLIGNSSFGIREASFLGLPVINLGDRQRKRLRGPNVMDIKTPQELQSFSIPQDLPRYPSNTIYGEGNSGQIGAQILSSWHPTIKSRN